MKSYTGCRGEMGRVDPASNYMFKVNNKDTGTIPLTSIVDFVHISHLVLVFLLSTLSR